MYARVMTQVSGEELSALMAEEGFISRSDERLDELVQAGFEGWKASDEALRQGSSIHVTQIPDRGEAREADMEQLFELMGAEQEAGWHHVRLVENNGERHEEATIARVWAFPTEGANVRRVADRVSSLSVRGPNGFQGFVERAGLNLPGIAAKVRELVGGGHPDQGRSPRATGFFDGAGAARVAEAEWADWTQAAALDASVWQSGGVLLAWAVRLLHRGTRTQTWSGVQAWLARPDLTEGRWLSAATAAEFFRLLWRNRRRQNLVVPPHRRAEASGFSLGGLPDLAVRITPEVLRSVPEFDQHAHDFEIVPIAALTIEPRNDVVMTEVYEAGSSNEAFEIIDATYRPSADFLERVLTAAASLPSARSPGESSVYALLVAEPERLASADPIEHALAFGVYVGATNQDVVARYEQHRDPASLLRASSLSWQGLEPVGIVRLGDRFRGISTDAAATLERDLADALRRQGLRVLGGH
jgi:hypothetical protein